MELNQMFKDGMWSKGIDVADFVYNNLTPYEGDASFLVGPTERTKKIWDKCLEALAEERANNGVRSLDNVTVSTITSHKAGYIDRENELIVGLQTDELLKRAIKPFGGIKVVEKACLENGVQVDEKVKDIFYHYRKTHNDGVFDAYTDEIRTFRSLGFLTGLPDNYARGRIIGDYRRLALYGLDRLIEAKKTDLKNLCSPMTDATIRLREEVSDQIKALNEMKVMGEYYGLDLSRPATTAQEAVQWVYMAYLASVKEQDGAAMSLGNVSTFLDIYIQYDLDHGNIDEVFAQELIDQFVIKLRMVRHLRMQSYNDIFAGDPTWITEAIGGRFNDGRTKVTKTSFRFLQTLYNLGPSPEPNMTVLWSPELPEGFKEFRAKVSIDTSSIQYENDTLMREVRNCDDYGIACCVSYQAIGKQIQFFGARCNFAKALLLAINGGRCENTGTLIVKDIPVLSNRPTPEQMPLARKYKELHEAGRDDLIPYTAMELTTVVAEALRMCRLENSPEEIIMNLTGIKLGSVALVGIPGEPFTDIGVGIKKAEGWDLILPCALTNGAFGYFPMKSAYDEGGYEARSSNYKSGVAERIIEGGIELLKDLRK